MGLVGLSAHHGANLDLFFPSHAAPRSAPDCFDEGSELYVLYACTDPSMCPFVLNDAPPAAAAGAAATQKAAANGAAVTLAATEAAAAATAATGASAGAVAVAAAADPCSGLTTCGACSSSSPADQCAWCVGIVYSGDAVADASGAACFSTASGGSDEALGVCQGTTLTGDCTVYKCPW
jgi:hypothetical protein